MLIALSLAATVAFAGQPPTACARPAGATFAKASLELAEKVKPRDTVAVVRVCLATKDPAVRIGSYHGLITWDSTAARLIKAQKGKVGMRLENTLKPGVVDFAGAFPAGLNDTVILTLQMALLKPGKVPTLRLHMFELNSTAGTVLTSRVSVSGFPSSLRTTPGPLKKDSSAVVVGVSGNGGSTSAKTTGPAPQLTAISRSPGGPGDPPLLVLRGTGFLPTGNFVLFENANIGEFPSTDGGTVMRVVVPEVFPSNSEAPPMRVLPGVYGFAVKNARGTSNALKFELKF